MRRKSWLWPNVFSFEALCRAARKAERRKRSRRTTGRFAFFRELELLRLHEELRDRRYRPGGYRTFFVYEPKRRLISASPFRDRVVHHALTSVLEPIFERSFVFDSYACRKGKGTHAAVRRCQQFAKKFPFVLKADIRKFFPSIDHEILKRMIRRKIKDPDVLWLCDLIIDHSNSQEPVLEWFPGDDLLSPSERRRGVPLGNQTSQFFANVYLDPLDHFITESLSRDRQGVNGNHGNGPLPDGRGSESRGSVNLGYVRYVDDFLVFAHTKAELHDLQRRIAEFLATLRLKPHLQKNVILPTRCGISFLGYRVFPTHRLLAKSNLRRFWKRVRRMQRLFREGRITLPEIRQRIMSWLGHARQANTHRLVRRLLREITFEKVPK